MIEVPITEPIRKAAAKLADHKVYSRSMRGKEANIVGAYGEVIVYSYLRDLKLSPVFAHKTTHDIEVRDITFDVKTKERTVEPKPYYDCTVPAYNHSHQRPNLFVFVSLKSNKKRGPNRFTNAWVLGMISYSDLERKARYWEKGQIDPDNGWKASIDCFNVQISDLKLM